MRTQTDILYQALVIGSVVLLIDQGTKYIANKYELITLNPGISFGIFGSEHPVISFFMLLAMGVIVAALIQQHWHKYPVATGLFVGGALSNIADRIARGGVRDWLPVGPLPLKNNLADWAIFCAALLVMYAVYREDFAAKKIKRKTPQRQTQRKR